LQKYNYPSLAYTFRRVVREARVTYPRFERRLARDAVVAGATQTDARGRQLPPPLLLLLLEMMM